MVADSDTGNNTFFASPNRSSAEEIERDHSDFVSHKSFIDILGAISGIVLVLNENRQIIYGNEDFVRALGLGSVSEVLGKRPGEALGCIHSGSMEAGCGTSEACAVCGAVNSIVDSQNSFLVITNQNNFRARAQLGNFMQLVGRFVFHQVLCLRHDIGV